MNGQKNGQAKDRKMRRSRRVALQAPVLVYEPGTENRSIVDDTFAVMVNKHGAMIALSRDVHTGQKLLVINKTTKESKECRVADIGPTHGEKRWVGVEFTQPAPEFWGICFPPVRPAPAPRPTARASAKPAAIQ
jgi:hypothetical protein